jgi:endonuclease V-like protein UPF0215 family
VRGMKDQVRVLGIDDSPFEFGDRRALVVGALVRAPGYLEAVMRTDVEVDGDDSTDRLVEMVMSSRYRDQVKLVMLDGIALAGFNVVDMQALHRRTGLAVATVTRDEPDLGEMESALRKHFDDWESRLSLVKALPLRPLETGHKPVHASVLGMDWDDFVHVARATTVRGAIPEPLRIAHLVSAAVVRGESRGRS